MQTTVIKPKKIINFDFKELWRFRELFWTFAWRDIKVRYKQTAVGVLWALFQPFIMMVVFSVFFGRIADIDTSDIPYPIFSYVGLIFWNYFSNSLAAASASMVANQSIIQKIYFPRLILPVASTFVFILDFFCAFFILFVLMMYYHFTPTITGLLLVVPALLITFFTFTGLGLFFASVNVKYRDVRYVLPFFIQLLIFITPVIYPVSVLGRYRWLWLLNPMSGVIDTMRNSLLGVAPVNWHILGASFALSVVFLLVGLFYFSKTEKYFADLI